MDEWVGIDQSSVGRGGGRTCFRRARLTLGTLCKRVGRGEGVWVLRIIAHPIKLGGGASIYKVEQVYISGAQYEFGYFGIKLRFSRWSSQIFLL